MTTREGFDGIWEEKYRPQNLDDVVIPEDLRKQLKNYVAKNEIPNFLFVSSVPGTGKTTIVQCLLNEIDPDYKWINASENNNVSTIRNDIVGFAGTMSAQGKSKVLVLDEADNLTTSSQGSAGAQDILRGVIEQFASNARFFLTGNYAERFIDPLVSRFKLLDFDTIFSTNKKELGIQMYKRLCGILENESIEYDKKDVQEIIKKHFPSMRNMTIALQNNIFENKLVLKNTDVDDAYVNIFELVKTKNFQKLRSELMIINNPSSFYTWFWKNMDEYIELSKQPSIILELARYQEMDKIANNKEITLMAFLTKTMSMM